MSYPQQVAVTATGVIWSRFSTQIVPVNYNLLSVNLFMAFTGSYQLYRKISHDYFLAEIKEAAETAKALPKPEGK